MKIKLNEMIEIKDNPNFEADADIEIFSWSVSDGEKINQGDKLVEVMVGKTSIDLTAPASGKVKILVEDGEIVSGDDVVAEII